MSKIEVNQIDTISGSSTLLVGPSAATKLTFSSTLTVDFNVNSPGVTLNDTMKMTPAFHAYSNVTTSCPNNTTTKLKMDTEVYDTDSCYDPVLYRFTPNVSGKYRVYMSARFGNTIDFNEFAVLIRKNGSNITKFGMRVEHSPTVNCSTVVEMNGTTDYLEAYGFQNSGGTENFNGGSIDETFFGAFKVIGA